MRFYERMQNIDSLEWVHMYVPLELAAQGIFFDATLLLAGVQSWTWGSETSEISTSTSTLTSITELITLGTGIVIDRLAMVEEVNNRTCSCLY
jgi:hypothetical protein